jgi:O-succinylbenzoic acid--CoA ligase
VALDLPLGPGFVREATRQWEDGNAVLPLDQRMPSAARRRMAVQLGATHLCTADTSEPLPAPDDSLVPLSHDDALVIATSGATGAPKGVVHTHESLACHARMVGERLGLSANDHWWLCLPPAHIGGFGVVVRALHTQATLAFAAHVDDEAIADALRGGATHTSVVPTHVARHDFRGWRVVLVGGQRSADLPDNAVATYGLTETGGGIVYDSTPLAGVDVRIEDGEVLLRAPSMARTYRHAALPLADDWLRTGDLGVFDGASLRIDGRRDDLIVTGGNKVWPHVVERRLLEHPLVTDVAVRGVPDPEFGSLVCAYVVPRDAHLPPSLEMLRGHVKETLAAYCAPKKLVFTQRIPRNALGKVVSSELHSA